MFRTDLLWIDWFDLLAVQGTLMSLLQHHSSKTSILWCSAFFIVQLSHPYMTTGKTTALTRQTFANKAMSLLLATYFINFSWTIFFFSALLWFSLSVTSFSGDCFSLKYSYLFSKILSDVSLSYWTVFQVLSPAYGRAFILTITIEKKEDFCPQLFLIYSLPRKFHLLPRFWWRASTDFCLQGRCVFALIESKPVL